ncbi:MAG: hypothetical protein AAF639_09685 [Chloroflexota bacterium]
MEKPTILEELSQGSQHNDSSNNDAQTEQTAESASWLAWLTVERFLYGLILMAGIWIRFYELNLLPMSLIEAINAWPAWLASANIDLASMASSDADAIATPSPTSALLYSLHSTIFWLAGGNDTLARFIPAVMGSLLILLPWWLRSRDILGRDIALFLALLIAFDPWLIVFSRLADSAILSTFLGLLMLIGLIQVVRLAQERTVEDKNEEDAATSPTVNTWINVIAVCAGLLLVSGPQAWSFIPVLIMFALIFIMPMGLVAFETGQDDEEWDDEESDSEESDSEEADRDEAGDEAIEEDDEEATAPILIPRMSIVFFLGALILGSTAWLARPEGLAYIGSSLGVWRQQLTGASSDGTAFDLLSYSFQHEFSWPFIRLLIDQPLLIIFGLFGLVGLFGSTSNGAGDHTGDDTSSRLSLDRDSRWLTFLLLWLAWGLLLAILPGRNPFSLLMLDLPLLIFASHGLASLPRLYGRIMQPIPIDDEFEDAYPFSWGEAGFLFTVLVILLVADGFWVSALVSSFQFSAEVAGGSLLIVLLMALLVILYTLWAGWDRARLVTGVFLAVTFLSVNVSSAWQLSHRQETMHPDGFFAELSHSEVRMLASDMQTLSAQRTGDAGEIPVYVELGAQPDPVLGWYLRDMRRLQWVGSPSIEAYSGIAPLTIATTKEYVTSEQTSSASISPNSVVLPDEYIGTDYTVRSFWLPSDLPNPEIAEPELADDVGFIDRIQQQVQAQWTGRLKPRLRWVLYRESKQPPATETVILWASRNVE